MSPTRARPCEVPALVASRGEVASADRVISYEVAVEGPATRSAEDWARATFEGAPTAVRWFLVMGWRIVLGLRLRQSASDTVLGWSITERRPETIMLEARSPLITGHNLAILQDGSVSWITLVRYDSHLARPVWRLTELIHRLVVPYIFTRAARVHLAQQRR